MFKRDVFGHKAEFLTRLTHAVYFLNQTRRASRPIRDVIKLKYWAGSLTGMQINTFHVLETVFLIQHLGERITDW